MAAVSEARPSKSSKDMLKEVGRFVQGCSYRSNISLEEKTRTALYLIQTLPSTRTAVLEHFHVLFDEAANAYIRHLDKDSDNDNYDGQLLDTTIDDVSNVLLKFIKLNPEAWAPIISAWSIEILGQISSKYSSRRGVPHSNSLNELLQLWMNCKSTNTLMDITSECFSSMIGVTSADSCVDALLEASVKHSPHFDWVVAHIGSSFPTTIITRVLTCGLKDYCSQDTNKSSYDRENIPKMASVVGILSHLASRHGNDIQKALLNLFEDSLSSSPSDLRSSAVPFLLHLASMSSLLLRVIATEFIHNLTPAVLNKLCIQYRTWDHHGHDEGSLLSLIIHLLMKTDEGALTVLQFILNPVTMANKDSQTMTIQLNPAVELSCTIILDHLVVELQRIVYSHSNDPSTTLPLLSSLNKHREWISTACLHMEDHKRHWLGRLLSCIGIYCGETAAADILCHVLFNAHSHQLDTFISIQQELENCLPDIIQLTVTTCIDRLCSKTDKYTSQCLHNLLSLVNWEKSLKLPGRTKLMKSLQNHIVKLSTLLYSDSLELSVLALQLLNTVTFSTNIRAGDTMKLSSHLMGLLFRLLSSHDDGLVSKGMSVLKSYIKQLSVDNLSRNVFVRLLITAALNKDNSLLLGQCGPYKPCDRGNIERVQATLLYENAKPSAAVMMSQSHLSVFHAGIIGHGATSIDNNRTRTYSMQQKVSSRQIILDLLWICCYGNGNESNKSSVVMETEGNDSVKNNTPYYLCEILVELICPDVLYNTPFWPEEGTVHVTIERDLHVKKKFDDNPVLWDVLLMLSTDKNCILKCACLLRSVMATLLLFWDGCREKVARNAPRQLEVSCQLLDCLRKSQLLPKPLCYLGELFSCIAPHEVYLLLSTVWRYLQHHPSQLDISSGRLITPLSLEPIYLESIKAIIHNNIETLGDLYSRFAAV